MSLENVKTLADTIRAEIGKAIIGQTDTVDLMLVALFSGGHILLEGVPGTAKTFLAQVFSHVTKMDFGRIQFTPDLMPGDLLGTNLFSFQTNDKRRSSRLCKSAKSQLTARPSRSASALWSSPRKIRLNSKGHILCPRRSLTALSLSMFWIIPRAMKRLKLSAATGRAQVRLSRKIWASKPLSRARILTRRLTRRTTVA